MERRRKPKRTRKEVDQMGSGGLMLLGIILKLVRAILERGGTMQGIHALDTPSGALVIRRMVEAFFGAGSAVVGSFPIWRTVQLGTHKTIAKIKADFAQAGLRIGDWASQVLEKITLSPKVVMLELVRVSGAELGQTTNETLAQICARARTRGLDRCPAEVGPALREQYTDQPMSEVLWIAMEPITGAVGNPGVFDVGHVGGGQWLGTDIASPGGVWDPGRVWVFVRSKQ